MTIPLQVYKEVCRLGDVTELGEPLSRTDHWKAIWQLDDDRASNR